MLIIRRILIANRGEIAVRVIRTCQRLGIETVLATAETDADSVPARLADRTISLGPGGLSDWTLWMEMWVRARRDPAVRDAYFRLDRRQRKCGGHGGIDLTPARGQNLGDDLRRGGVL